MGSTGSQMSYHVKIKALILGRWIVKRLIYFGAGCKGRTAREWFYFRMTRCCLFLLPSGIWSTLFPNSWLPIVLKSVNCEHQCLPTANCQPCAILRHVCVYTGLQNDPLAFIMMIVTLLSSSSSSSPLLCLNSIRYLSYIAYMHHCSAHYLQFDCYNAVSKACWKLTHLIKGRKGR